MVQNKLVRGVIMKKTLCLTMMLAGMVSAVYAFDCETTVPLPGETMLDEKMQTEVLQPVYAYALRVAAPECQSLSILDTKLSKEKVDNAWQEVWVVKACSKKAAIPINFTIQEDKTEYAIDPMGVKVKDKVPGMVITK